MSKLNVGDRVWHKLTGSGGFVLEFPEYGRVTVAWDAGDSSTVWRHHIESRED